MRVNVNCKQADGFGYCNKMPKSRLFGCLWMTKELCPEWGQLSYSCEIAERYPRPDAPPPPASPKKTCG